MPEQTSGKRTWSRRRQVMAGTAGLAVVGAGAFLVSTKFGGGSDPGAPEVAAPAPVVSASVSSAATPPESRAASPSPSSPPASPSKTETVKQKQDAVEGKARKDEKVNVKRPVPQTKVWAAASDLHRSETKVGADQIRMTSAAQDLTGQHELSWVAGAGDKHGDVECTNRIRLTQGAPVMVRPTLLVCWRTSARQSVFTVSTNPTGKPSWEAAVDSIDKEWKRLAARG